MKRCCLIVFLMLFTIVIGFSQYKSERSTEIGSEGVEKDKKTDIPIPPPGISFKPFPLVNYDSDVGVGLGVSVTLFSYDGKSKDYRWKIYTEFFMTTGGQMDPDIRFDIPSLWIAGQPFRIEGSAEYSISLFDTYFGYGDTLQYDETKFTNYYYSVKKTRPYLYFTISTPLLWGKQFGYNQTLDLLLGSYLEDYRFEQAQPPDNILRPAYFIDNPPPGSNGGTIFSMMTGIRFDNRDFEPNPHKGTYNELMFEFAVAGSYNYSRLTFKHSAYFEPFPTWGRLVLAERVMVDQLFGDVPFFKAQLIGGIESYEGLGGADSMRGITRFRFIDNLKIVLTPEIRFRFLDFGPFLWDMWHLEAVLFSDIGNAWHNFSDFRFDEVLATWGMGLRVLWGEDFIIAADLGFWNGGNGIYIGFGHQF